jgi:hypothetical protein
MEAHTKEFTALAAGMVTGGVTGGTTGSTVFGNTASFLHWVKEITTNIKQSHFMPILLLFITEIILNDKNTI